MKEVSWRQVTNDFLKNLWLQGLPSNIQTVLAVSGDELDKHPELADKVSEFRIPSNNIIAAISEKNEIKSLQLQVSELTRKLDRLTTSYAENRSCLLYRRRNSSFSRICS